MLQYSFQRTELLTWLQLGSGENLKEINIFQYTMMVPSAILHFTGTEGNHIDIYINN